jgi:hypothetical protein
MKRYVIAVALGLIFVFGLSLNAAGKQRPEYYKDPADMSDDHTWGGENGWGDTIDPGDEGFQAGMQPWQHIVNRLIMFIVPDGKAGTRTTEIIVLDQTTQVEKQHVRDNVQSSKGK